MQTQKLLLTAEQFARLPEPKDGSKQELVKGVVITMPPPAHRHGKTQARVALVLGIWSDRDGRGTVTTESGVITDTGPDTVRGPDVAWYSVERLPFDHEPVVYANVTPDLSVEILSPSNSDEDIIEKVSEYFAAGVRMVWVLDPQQRTVIVYRGPGNGRILWPNATLDGEDVLHGFSCQVAALFDRLPTNDQ